ncbi:hypothetical protein X759_21590 [Mesorhizobium sp. LSHC420B00]|nr:hypothetical protein X759_21590 [Mesorhizobium sp. LSHC420B00]
MMPAEAAIFENDGQGEPIGRDAADVPFLT